MSRTAIIATRPTSPTPTNAEARLTRPAGSGGGLLTRWLRGLSACQGKRVRAGHFRQASDAGPDSGHRRRGREHAAEIDVLLAQAPLRAAACNSLRKFNS